MIYTQKTKKKYKFVINHERSEVVDFWNKKDEKVIEYNGNYRNETKEEPNE